MKSDKPAAPVVAAWHMLASEMIGHILVARNDGSMGTIRDVRRVNRAFQAACRGVRGNRASDSPYHWGDHRAMIRAMIRVIAEEADREPPEK